MYNEKILFVWLIRQNEMNYINKLTRQNYFSLNVRTYKILFQLIS